MTSSSSSLGTINIAASAQKLDVDNRIALRFYFRIADNILRQADIFRAEKNIIDLYVMLLRFSSLVTETIPRHRDYRSSPQSRKESLRKKLLISLSELEKLKPLVLQKINELNSRHVYQQNGRGKIHSNNSVAAFSPVKKQTLASYGQIKTVRPTAREFVYQGSGGQQYSYVRPVEEQVRRLSLTLPPPKEETLSRHSILGPNGLNGQWRPPTTDKGVRYPTNIDLSPVDIPRTHSLQHSLEDESLNKKDNSIAEPYKSDLDSILTQSEDSQPQQAQEPPSLISFEAIETPARIEVIRQPSPPPVLAEVQDLVPAVSPQVNEAGCLTDIPSSDSFVRAESPLQLHISTAMMDSFMKLAKSNTKKNLETCGILAGVLKNRKFYITALIIPKQESTSDSCQATNEEEIFEVQDKRSLFPLGWIHTHPTQSCFMSSIDLHTHYSYQIMLPESVAIVMAPKDSSRNHGIFRLTTPGGMSVIKQCDQRGFHPHNQPPDGGPIYDTCTDVYMNPDLKFDVIDLR
ncbi:AMSH-like ubiquitin thioesterase 1 [Lotus japonicus]|uniref:Associated molecule with the SH3 domain of STAM 1 n=2 Tax=Lotus japonicus TaxID=34305 RepID=A0A0H4LWA1_LOTJA|nr:AMSH-like ubiquitin thioesterase 1 [Lotus japonicus]AKP20512.1 associated molecule with the SH3 domain of STAM 1 [Lotus japonicus]